MNKNVCADNNTASQNQRKNQCITITFEDVNASLPVKERTNKNKSWDLEDFNNMINEPHLTAVYNTIAYMFFFKCT